MIRELFVQYTKPENIIPLIVEATEHTSYSGTRQKKILSICFDKFVLWSDGVSEDDDYAIFSLGEWKLKFTRIDELSLMMKFVGFVE